MKENMTRAQFLKKMFTTASDQVTKAVDKRVEALTPDRPRPPWSLTESEFLGTCEKCRSCGEICPQDIIYYHGEDSLIAAGTPYLDFTEDYCDYCGECVKACPSGALNFERGHKEPGKALISKNACIAFSGTICRYCAEACPELAITMEVYKYPKIDIEKCNGCGACISPCIGEAIDIKELKREI
ncbi:MAG: 4Fe-4S dicluster domain-containing protein [Deltaproteobacteria bacterium]|nr:4Fe-4S dicluster domain-containing protein [Deltaproteobacteria bacterium]